MKYYSSADKGVGWGWVDGTTTQGDMPNDVGIGGCSITWEVWYTFTCLYISIIVSRQLFHHVY